MKNFSSKTKENSLLNSKKNTIRNAVLGILFVVFILVYGKDFVSSAVSIVTTPLFFARHYLETSAGTVPVFVRGRIELLDQIRSLQEEVASHQGIDNTLRYITKENDELRSLLHASSSPRILAGVIARPPDTPYDILILDRGTDDGIVQHAPVFQGNGHAIGYVHRVFPHTAFVTLFSTPGAESTVYIYGPNIFSTAYGEGGGVIHLSVPQGIAIQKGDLVVLPSHDTGLIGTIDAIQSVPSEPEQHAYVTFMTPLQSMRLVSVGTIPLVPMSYESALEYIQDEEKMRFSFEVPAGQSDVPLTSSSSIATSSMTTQRRSSAP